MTAVTDDPFTRIEKMSLAEYVPLRAMIELSYRCNFRCVMCYLVEFRSPGELTTAELEDVMDQLAAMGCLVLTFTGGEPLLRKDFFAVATYARERRFAIRIFTNGFLIDRDRADRLQELRPLSIEISLYGMSDETYAAVTGRRGRGRHARVMGAIRRLRDRDLPVQIKVPVLQQNYHDIDAIQAFAQEVGAGFAANPNITPKDDGDLAPLAHALDDEALEDYYRRYVPTRELGPLPPDGLMCNTARNALVISPLGDVFPCVQIKRSVGNVRERPLRDIWAGSPLLDQLRGLRVRDYPGCGGCGGCGSGQGNNQCAGIAHATTGSYTGGDPLAARLVRIRARAARQRKEVDRVTANN